MHIYIYAHVYTYIRIHVYISTCIHIYIDIYLHLYISISPAIRGGFSETIIVETPTIECVLLHRTCSLTIECVLLL